MDNRESVFIPASKAKLTKLPTYNETLLVDGIVNLIKGFSLTNINEKHR